MTAASLSCARSRANVELAFGRNLALDAEAIAQLGTIATYASHAEAKPRLPF